MRKITDKLKTVSPLVSDGAWGTLLLEGGLQAGTCAELWCVENPDAVRGIAERYVEAGSDLVQTNSFGANRFKLDHFGLAGRTVELNEAAAALSREAAGDRALVIASVGPTGKLLLMDDVTETELYDAFAEQAAALERGGADACCIETFTAVDEAVQAIKAARENTGLEVLCTFAFERTVQGEYRTMMGVSPTDMVRAALDAGADIVGANCGNGMEQMVDIVTEIRAATAETPVLVHANAGLPVTVDGVDTFPEAPETTARRAIDVVKAGADIVGGCCGTTPEHIKAIAKAVRND